MTSGMISQKHAGQIADLLDAEAQSTVPYSAKMVLQHADDYICEIQDDVVIACVEVKKVQWYQWEICHLSVSEAHERKGLGEQPRGRPRIRQRAVVRGSFNAQSGSVTREASKAFRRSGYREACHFFNASTDREVAVCKVLAHRE